MQLADLIYTKKGHHKRLLSSGNKRQMLIFTEILAAMVVLFGILGAGIGAGRVGLFEQTGTYAKGAVCAYSVDGKCTKYTQALIPLQQRLRQVVPQYTLIFALGAGIPMAIALYAFTQRRRS